MAEKRAGLAAIVLTKNVSKHIVPCIETLRFCDRIVVSDSYSDDDTVAQARAAGVEIIERVFDNFAGQRNAAMEAVDAEWIFFVDADERIPEALALEVRSVLAGPENGWWVPRQNFIAGQQVRHGGFYPDYQLHLMRRDRARYDPARPVHEVVLLDGDSAHLREPMIHYNYDDWDQFHAKQRRYAALEARILKQRGVKPWPHKFVTMPAREFGRRYLTLEGWRDGWFGLKLASLLAFYYGFMPHWYLARPPQSA
jgi:(heptosyl)LPS beta-1,4-glucosyltransferase